jgi:hypothetical protein
MPDKYLGNITVPPNELPEGMIEFPGHGNIIEGQNPFNERFCPGLPVIEEASHYPA